MATGRVYCMQYRCTEPVLSFGRRLLLVRRGEDRTKFVNGDIFIKITKMMLEHLDHSHNMIIR